MRNGWLALGVAGLVGCSLPDGGTLCPTEHLLEREHVTGTQLARLDRWVVWTETEAGSLLMLDLDTGNMRASGISTIRAFGRGMAAAGGRVYWPAVLDGFTNLYTTAGSGPEAGLPRSAGVFPGCGDPIGVAVDGDWWVGFADCGGAASVRTGNGETQTGDHAIADLRDVAAGFALTDRTIEALAPPSTIELPFTSARRLARRGGVSYVTGNDQLNAVTDDGAIELMVNYLPGATDLVVDDDAVYVATSTDRDPALWRVPLAGGEAEMIAAHLGSTIALAQDDTHVYWVTRGRVTQKGIWRVAKCR